MNLKETISEATDRAKQINRKVLVTYTEHCQDFDPFSFVVHQGDAHCFVWQRGDSLMGGGGLVWSVNTIGPDRFLELEIATREVLNPWVSGGVVNNPPYFWVSMSFDGRGNSCLWLPQWMIFGGGRLVLFDRVGADTNPDLVTNKLKRLLDRLHSTVVTNDHLSDQNYRSVIKQDDCDWKGTVVKALAEITSKRLEKVVLARKIEIESDREFLPFEVLAQLRKDHGDCTLFLMNLAAGKTFLGATPEILLQFRWEDDRLIMFSDALAGSAPRSTDKAEDERLGECLLQSNKDNREHQIVVESIESVFQNLGGVVYKNSAPNLLKLHHIQHLHTPIRVEWQTDRWQGVFRAMQALHPTAAVGGKPRDRALEFIRSVESFDREGYAAPVGWFNGNGEGFFAVAIRSGYIEQNRARIFAGSGIVSDSKIDIEREETTLKLQTLLQALGVVQN